MDEHKPVVIDRKKFWKQKSFKPNGIIFRVTFLSEV